MTYRTTENPIANMLNIEGVVPGKTLLITIAGRVFEYHPAGACTTEGLYRKDAGHSVGNPCFTLFTTPAQHHAHALGRYIGGFRKGVKRAEAVALAYEARVFRAVQPKP